MDTEFLYKHKKLRHKYRSIAKATKKMKAPSKEDIQKTVGKGQTLCKKRI